MTSTEKILEVLGNYVFKVEFTKEDFETYVPEEIKKKFENHMRYIQYVIGTEKSKRKEPPDEC